MIHVEPPENASQDFKRHKEESTQGHASSSSLDLLVTSLTAHALANRCRSDFDDDDTPYQEQGQDWAFLQNLTSEMSCSGSEGLDEDTLGTGSKLVGETKRPTGRQANFASALTNTALLSHYTSYDTSTTSTHVRQLKSAPTLPTTAKAKAPHKRSFSWAPLLSNNTQSEIDDVFM